jgi:hypothetical protein
MKIVQLIWVGMTAKTKAYFGVSVGRCTRVRLLANQTVARLHMQVLYAASAQKQALPCSVGGPQHCPPPASLGLIPPTTVKVEAWFIHDDTSWLPSIGLLQAGTGCKRLVPQDRRSIAHTAGGTYMYCPKPRSPVEGVICTNKTLKPK